jgi:membrane protein
LLYGFLLLVSLVVNAFLDLLSEKLSTILSNGLVVAFIVINNLLILAITSSLFHGICRFLPDARVHWKDLVVGSMFTSILFMIGKYLITLYISKSTFTITYGAAASIIIMLVWVYYSAAILYLGAEFTKQYAIHAGKGITPKEDAFMVHQEEFPINELQGTSLKS